jgi:hypothetical protein
MEIAEDGKIALYGVLDTKDNVWLGDEFGPKRFDDFVVARIAAQVAEMQVFGTDLACRFEARPIPGDSYKKRDDMPTRMGAEEALNRVENSGGESQPIEIAYGSDGWEPPVTGGTQKSS